MRNATERRPYYDATKAAGNSFDGNLDPVDLTILKNPRLIAVNQDGAAAKRIYNSPGGGVQQVWSKRERNGDYIVALFNTGTSGNQTVSINWSTQADFHVGLRFLVFIAGIR